MPKKHSKQNAKEEKEWPVVVYLWAIGSRLVGYLVVGEAVFESRPHPIHWLSGLIGGILGIGIGWLWYRWRGDVFSVFQARLACSRNFIIILLRRLRYE